MAVMRAIRKGSFAVPQGHTKESFIEFLAGLNRAEIKVVSG